MGGRWERPRRSKAPSAALILLLLLLLLPLPNHPLFTSKTTIPRSHPNSNRGFVAVRSSIIPNTFRWSKSQFIVFGVFFLFLTFLLWYTFRDAPASSIGSSLLRTISSVTQSHDWAPKPDQNQSQTKKSHCITRNRKTTKSNPNAKPKAKTSHCIARNRHQNTAVIEMIEYKEDTTAGRRKGWWIGMEIDRISDNASKEGWGERGLTGM